MTKNLNKFLKNNICFLKKSVFSPAFLFYYTILLIVGAYYFKSKGPIYLLIISSFFVVWSLSGFRIKSETYKNIVFPKSEVSIWYGLIVFHSHHPSYLCEMGYEFKIKTKYFCTGCYGLLIGTIIANIVAIVYLFFGFNSLISIILTVSIPIWFVPIILRYSVFPEMKTFFRLLANAFVPIGCAVILTLFDYFFQEWVLNLSFILIIFFIAYLRRFASIKNQYKS